MIRHIWYYFMKYYVKTALFFTMKKVKVFGKENIPKKGAVLFIGNHQNALIDALLIPAYNNRKTHFLSRAGAFRNKTVAKILSSLNMLPAYRLRDGLRNMTKNFDVFKKCVTILKNNGAVEIFAEGEHHLERRIIPLKKGFARILLATLKEQPELNIQIIPVGLNYDTRLGYPASCHLHYGKPIETNKYFDTENPDMSFSEILKVVSNSMKELTLHIECEDNYKETILQLENVGVNYLEPKKANKLLKKLKKKKLKPKKKITEINWFAPFHWLAKLNSIIPLLIWKKLKGGIKEVIFTNTFRFALIATLFPIFYLIQTGIIGYFFNGKIALIYLAITILLGFISAKTMKPTRLEHLE
ncbi:1-acyl-sn-glycerol-3-phosphate acyltransferase [Lutibacter oricola]|uniref:1-acyl-sn-glycerol-3-phosphate acyltransferase n=1 Tax=Lutibacter oricola TaxID=762486 RepID=A0A1H3C9Z2_9FLAO|nr:1-acyl-sn-glycerol-3-phosphate acyltransferase [Lutibacter oricola]SDX51002.1 1-acyl-sn-glycerol-3-phosphate acyltransferase [Lutibacter oricola]